MALTLDKVAVLAEDERADLDLLRSKAGDPVKDKSGSASNSLAGSLRFLAVADYVLNKDVPACREQLSEATGLRLKLLQRFDAGEPISPSYVSMMVYKSLLNALAAGSDALAQAVAARMGGREAIEAEYDRPFDRAFGYCLKGIVTHDALGARRALHELEEACEEVENVDFRGYARALHSIIDHSPEMLPQAFIEIIAGHKRQSVGLGLFKDTEDEVLCVWGVAVANLARWKGLPAPEASPLLPAELIR
jgi:hypothetical protein